MKLSTLNNEQLLEVLSVFSARSLDSILEKSVEIIPSVFNWKGCSVFLYDEGDDILKLARTSGLSSNKSREVTYKRNEGLTGWVFNNQEPLLIRDLDKKTNEDLKSLDVQLEWKGKFSESNQNKAKSFMAVPMKSQNGKFIGLMRSASDLHNFNKSDLDVFLLISRLVAMAIENAELLKKEKRKTNYLELLMNVGTQILSFTDIKDLLDFVAENTAKTISSETCEIYLRKKEDKNSLILIGGYGIPKELINVASHTVGEGLTGTIVKENRTIRSKNVLLLPEYKGKYRNAIKSHLKFGDRLTFMGMPIKIKKTTVGAIKLYNKISNTDTGKYFTKNDEHYLRILSDMISVAIENVDYVDTMKLSAVKTMKRQRLTALGTLAMRIPNDVVNPLTEAQLGINNIIQKSKKNKDIPKENLMERLLMIKTNLQQVAGEVRVLQEFSTRAGFIHVKRTWKELLDESMLFLTSDFTAKKINIKRDKENENQLPEISVDPNEIIEVLISLISLIISRFEHYGSTIQINVRITPDKLLVTNIIGINNKDGVKISSKSVENMLGDSKDYSPNQFSLEVINEIITSSYQGDIKFNESDSFSRVVLELPLERY